MRFSTGLPNEKFSLYICAWKNKGLKINPCRTLALMIDHLDESNSLMSVAKK